jgi:signal transduction histidine kinase
MTFFNVQDSIKVFDERIPQFTDELSFRASMALENSLLYENLLEAVKARDQFISIASHELKTPLTSLSLQNQMRELFLNKNNSEPFSKQDYLKMLSADYYQLQRINRLIDDMLDISRIRGGHLHLDKEYFGLRFFVNDVVQRFYPQVEACGGQVLIDQGQEINVKVDAFRIEQVLINLLTNAVKYSPGSPIKIEFQTLSSSVRVLIHDEGPGIPLEDQDRIFLRFERSVANHVVSGLGLGLYISREIMQQHNGTLSVKSEPGHGSTFILEFPL